MAEPAAVLALWNDVDPAHVDEYEAWHTLEHVPERVANPGFVAGRRYRAGERSTQRYFTLYTLDSLDALRSSRYADVVARPTAWSLHMRGRLRDFRRHACNVVAHAGRGYGGAIGTLVVDAGSVAIAAEALAHLATELVEAGTVIKASIGCADTASAFPLADALRSARAEQTPYVVIVDALDRGGAEAALAHGEAWWRARGAAPVLRAAYDLVFEIERAALPNADEGRPPPRDDLRRRWAG